MQTTEIFSNHVCLKVIFHYQINISTCFTRPEGILTEYGYIIEEQYRQSYNPTYHFTSKR